jgi:monovalent cation:H+ antiporter-2, CPA2 family
MFYFDTAGVVALLSTAQSSGRFTNLMSSSCIPSISRSSARDEFSIVIAGLGTAIEPRLGPLAAAYVLFMAILGPMLARFAK